MKIGGILFLPLFVFLNAASGSSEFEIAHSELDRELEWIRAEAIVVTEIATKTEMDADLVPGMVTVLDGRDLEIQGIGTVYEALSLVPGVHTYINSLGDRHVSVRGAGGAFFSGNLKVMLDGVVLNDSLYASAYAIFDIPVEQVERIEIIRGPGSVIYGEYAYAGVISVTTRKGDDRVFARWEGEDGSPYGYGGGTSLSYDLPEKDFSLSLNVSGWKSEGPNIEAGEDRLYAGIAGLPVGDFSKAPGPSNESQENRMISLFLGYKGFSLLGQYLFHGMGDHFGIISVLPPESDRIVATYEQRTTEARQHLEMSDAIGLDLRGGVRRYEFHLDNAVGIPGISIPLPDGSAIDVSPPEGSLAGPYYEERELYAGAEVLWEGKGARSLLLGTKYSNLKMGDIWVDSNSEDDSFGTMVRLEGKSNWLDEDRRRESISVYVQGLFDITKHFTLTGGLRYTRHNDMGGSLTPRISAVWQLSERHILKAQYSEAVRPPTFAELYSKGNSVFNGNPELEPEHIRSYELGYIHRRPETTARMTLFCSELEDNIEYPKYANNFGGINIQYHNAAHRVRTRGAELEWTHRIGPTLSLDANLSYSDTAEEHGEPIAGSADWLGNAGLLYRPAEDYALSLRYRYVGERHRVADDDRDGAAACHTLNLSASLSGLFTDLLGRGLTLRCGVRNLFDADIVHPAPVFRNEEGNIGHTYEDDFPRPGRTWWFQLSYAFASEKSG